MRYFLSIILLAAVCAAMSGCSQKLRGKDYVNWVEDPEHGLLQTYAAGGYRFEVQYLPPVYLAYQAAGTLDLSEAELQEQAALRGEMEHFRVRIYEEDRPVQTAALRSTTPAPEIADTELFLQFQNEYSLELWCGDQALKPALYHYEGSMGMLPYRSLNLAFASTGLQGNRELRWNDRALSGETLRFLFSETNLHSNTVQP